MSTRFTPGPRAKHAVSRERAPRWTVLLHLLVLVLFVVVVVVLRRYGYEPVTALGLIGATAATAAGTVRQMLNGAEQTA